MYMEKEFLQECIDKKLSGNQIAKLVNKSANTISYWLTKFDLKTSHLSFKDKPLKDYCGERYCPRCNDKKPLNEFYNRRGKEGSSVYCKKCTSNQSLERQRELKLKCVEYKGGKCQIQGCGYNRYQGALEFHHLDPEEKDFNLGELKSYSFNDKVKKELDKCMLVCSNCHREIHGGVIKI